MAKERGSAMVAMAVLILLMLSLQCELAHTANIVVGELKGWTKNVTGWGKGKRFFWGEALEFRYPKGQHNVVVVNKTGYDTCKAGPHEPVHTSGNDIISLVVGDNYFICTFPGHCPSMMIKVTAEDG